LGVHRQNPDTHEAALVLFSSSALSARAERVARLKALIEAGLYKVDAGAIARALIRDGRRLRSELARKPTRRSLDTQVSA